MSVPVLQIKDFVGKRLRGFASIISDSVQLKTVHTHDYFELFLVNSGEAVHVINDCEIPLTSGSICFVRPEDVHSYTNLSPNFQIINIMVNRETMDALFAYLGEGFEPQRLFNAKTSPTAKLAPTEFSSLLEEFEQLVVYKEIMKDRSDALFKITLINIIARHFPVPIVSQCKDIPQWLRLLCLELLKKENFVEGLPAMRRIGGCSNEHLCRSFQKHLGKSPSQFINEVRLKHAAKLMLLTNDSILNICYDVGFNNLSNFYHLFKEHYQISPGHMRKHPGVVGVHDLVVQEEFFNNSISHGISPFQ